MAVDYTVQAEVIDLTSDSPAPSDSFLVDTNVWLNMVYSPLSQNTPAHLLQRFQPYSNYIKQARSEKSRLLRCGLSLAEMAHQIEAAEKTFYNDFVQDIQAKEYRHNDSDERDRVVGEIRNSWHQVKMMSEPIEVLIDDVTTESALGSLAKWPLDGHDTFFIEAMMKNSICQIITDDGDFATVSGIQVFTANTNVINTARRQKKLCER